MRLKAAAASVAGCGGASAVEVKGVKVLARRVDGVDKGQMRELVDQLRGKMGSGVVVLGAANDGKVTLIVGVTKDLTGRSCRRARWCRDAGGDGGRQRRRTAGPGGGGRERCGGAGWGAGEGSVEVVEGDAGVASEGTESGRRISRGEMLPGELLEAKRGTGSGGWGSQGGFWRGGVLGSLNFRW